MLKNVDRRLLTILLVIFVQMVGASMVVPILPLYAESQFDMSPRTITLLIGAFFAAQLVAGPAIGRWSDRVGRVPVLIVSQIGTVISFVMLAYAPSVGWLFASRILDGVTGGNIIVARAYVVDVTEPEKRTQSLAYISAAFGLGFIIGPGMGGILSYAFGIRMPYLVAAVAAALVVILTWRTLDESLTPEIRERNSQGKGATIGVADIGRNRPLLQILSAAFLGQFSLGVLQTTFALYIVATMLSDYSDEAANLGVGLMFAFFGISQVLTQAFAVPRIIARLRDAQMAMLGMVARCIGLALLSIITSPFVALIAIGIMAFGIGTSMPALNSLATTSVSDDVRGGVQGIYQSTLNMSIIFSSMIAGLMFEIRPNLPLLFGAALAFIALFTLIPILRQPVSPITKTPKAV